MRFFADWKSYILSDAKANSENFDDNLYSSLYGNDRDNYSVLHRNIPKVIEDGLGEIYTRS